MKKKVEILFTEGCIQYYYNVNGESLDKCEDLNLIKSIITSLIKDLTVEDTIDEIVNILSYFYTIDLDKHKFEIPKYWEYIKYLIKINNDLSSTEDSNKFNGLLNHYPKDVHNKLIKYLLKLFEGANLYSDRYKSYLIQMIKNLVPMNKNTKCKYLYTCEECGDSVYEYKLILNV